MHYLIVSRHPAAIQFIRETLSNHHPKVLAAPIIAQARPEDVRDAIIIGNVPLHLAALAREVWAVEFVGDPPRGQEYTVADMRAAGAQIRRYKITAQGSPLVYERAVTQEYQCPWCGHDRREDPTQECGNCGAV
jgi:hypothetical protein